MIPNWFFLILIGFINTFLSTLEIHILILISFMFFISISISLIYSHIKYMLYLISYLFLLFFSLQFIILIKSLIEVF